MAFPQFGGGPFGAQARPPFGFQQAPGAQGFTPEQVVVWANQNFQALVQTCQALDQRLNASADHFTALAARVTDLETGGGAGAQVQVAVDYSDDIAALRRRVTDLEQRPPAAAAPAAAGAAPVAVAPVAEEDLQQQTIELAKKIGKKIIESRLAWCAVGIGLAALYNYAGSQA